MYLTKKECEREEKKRNSRCYRSDYGDDGEEILANFFETYDEEEVDFITDVLLVDYKDEDSSYDDSGDLMDRMTRARVRKTCMVTPSWRTSTKLSSCIFSMEGDTFGG